MWSALISDSLNLCLLPEHISVPKQYGRHWQILALTDPEPSRQWHVQLIWSTQELAQYRRCQFALIPKVIELHINESLTLVFAQFAEISWSIFLWAWKLSRNIEIFRIKALPGIHGIAHQLTQPEHYDEDEEEPRLSSSHRSLQKETLECWLIFKHSRTWQERIVTS